MSGGIYIIESPSGKRYVGSAVHFKKRWRMHKHDLKYGVHGNQPLQYAFNKYGLENLKFEILLVCDPKNLLFYEQRAIDILKPEYNVCKVAGSHLGVKRKQSTIERQKGPKPPEHCKNLSIALKKALGTPEARLLNSQRQKVAQGSPEARKANSERQKLAQMKPEVRANKAGRKVLCVETGQVFGSGHEAAEWCHSQKLTTNKHAFVWINRAIRAGSLAYGLSWKSFTEEL